MERKLPHGYLLRIYGPPDDQRLPRIFPDEVHDGAAYAIERARAAMKERGSGFSEVQRQWDMMIVWKASLHDGMLREWRPNREPGSDDDA